MPYQAYKKMCYASSEYVGVDMVFDGGTCEPRLPEVTVIRDGDTLHVCVYSFYEKDHKHIYFSTAHGKLPDATPDAVTVASFHYTRSEPTLSDYAELPQDLGKEFEVAVSYAMRILGHDDINAELFYI